MLLATTRHCDVIPKHNRKCGIAPERFLLTCFAGSGELFATDSYAATGVAKEDGKRHAIQIYRDWMIDS